MNPNAPETCDGVDNNCDGLVDDADLAVNCNQPVDFDGDGFAEDVDCDDTDPDVNPNAPETCDGIDNNCDGLVDDADLAVSCTPQESVADLIDATYLQGSLNPEPTGPILRAELTRRLVYLKFDLSTFDTAITAAELQMQVASDPGFGTLEVFLGSHSNWTESSLNGANKPLMVGTALASISGTHSLGQTKTWNLDVGQISGGGMLTLIVKHVNGNDVAFASDETPQAPQLTIITESLRTFEPLLAFRITDQLSITPNPAVEETVISPKEPKTIVEIHVYDQIGRLVKTYQGEAIEKNGAYTLDVRSLSEGSYYIKSVDTDGNQYNEIMVVKKE